MFGLAKRLLLPEQMDDPSLDADRHHAALRGLARINSISRSASIFWPSIFALAHSRPATPLRVLDVATGGGDVPIAIVRRAQRAGVALMMHACDTSPSALRYAAAQAHAAGAPIEFFRADVGAESVPRAYDIVMCSLFLHHLDIEQARRVLRTLADAAGALLLVNDLRRSVPGYLAARIGTRLLSRSPIVHFDGPQSVRAAFTISEAQALARDAGLDGATVTPRFPFRFLLEWRR